MTYNIQPRTFHFRQLAHTSRGAYAERRSWIVSLSQDGHTGQGECAPLPQLSCDDVPHYPQLLEQACRYVATNGRLPKAEVCPWPSIRFGLESALLQLRQASSLEPKPTSPWALGHEGIPINGLVWMGTMAEMEARLWEKINEGFSCIKLKIGQQLEGELSLLAQVPHGIELRVDANGAYSPNEAPQVLERLAHFGLHSIEQPIRAGQWHQMAQLCATSPIPIALDEELIGIHRREDKERLLDTIRPHFIVLKPSLHGGIAGTCEWVELARSRGIGSWITSALESSVGLAAIAQLADNLYGPHIAMPQGLGTGQLFTDNIPSPICIRGQQLWHCPQ